jgi:hypothetical protein
VVSGGHHHHLGAGSTCVVKIGTRLTGSNIRLANDISLRFDRKVRVLAVLLVFIEAHHLAEELTGDLVKRGHLIRGDRDLYVLQMPDDRLELGIVNTIQRFYNFKIIGHHFLLMNCLLYRSKVLLVREINMVEKRALAWEETASYLK